MKSFLVTIMFSAVLITSVFSQQEMNVLVSHCDSLFNLFDNPGSLEYYHKAYD